MSFLQGNHHIWKTIIIYFELHFIQRKVLYLYLIYIQDVIDCLQKTPFMVSLTKKSLHTN